MTVITKTRTNIAAYQGSGRASDVAALAAAGPQEIYLHPGQSHASSDPALLSMILGSCVGVCLYDRGHSIGGATHYMLAKWEGPGKPSPRYGDVAIHSLVEQFVQRGCKAYELQAMVFGGASILQGFRGEREQGIGARNIEMAIEILAHYEILVVTKSVGGERGRKVKMRTDLGTVAVKLIENS